jgi:hypothetical protein
MQQKCSMPCSTAATYCQGSLHTDLQTLQQHWQQQAIWMQHSCSDWAIMQQGGYKQQQQQQHLLTAVQLHCKCVQPAF